MPVFSKEIEFKNLGFKYSSELPFVFREINLKLSQGHSIAIVGASGQGKSTLVNLLLRLYDSTEGEVKIDGINIKDFKIDWIRHRWHL